MIKFVLLGFFLVVSLVITIVTTRNIFDKIGNIKDVTEAKKKADKMFFAIYFSIILISMTLFIFAIFELKSDDMPIVAIFGLLITSTTGIFKSIDGIRKIFEDAKKEEDEKQAKKKRIFF